MPRLGQRLLKSLVCAWSFLLLAIVSRAQQQMVMPSNSVEIKDVNLDGPVDQLTEGSADGDVDCVLFGIIVVFLIGFSVGCPCWLYQIPAINP